MNRHDYSVIETIKLLHGEHTGTGPMLDEEYRDRLAWLRWRVGEAWTETSPGMPSMRETEETIRNLARHVIAIADGSQPAREVICRTAPRNTQPIPSKLTDQYDIDCLRSTTLLHAAIAMACDRDRHRTEAQVLLTMALEMGIRSDEDVMRGYDAAIETLQAARAGYVKRQTEADEIAKAGGR